MEIFAEGANATRSGRGPRRAMRAKAVHPLFYVYMCPGEQAGHARPADHDSGDQEGMHIAQCRIGQARLGPFVRLLITETSGFEHPVQEHGDILDACMKGKTARAVALLRAHIGV
jgi:hypothetical protein